MHAPLTVPARFSTEGNADMPDRWWEAFGDARLNLLIEDALRDNFSLRTAWDRLDQARAVARKSGSSLLPSVEGEVGASRSVQKTGETPSTYTSDYSLGLSISYEVDLWGRLRSAHEAERLEVHATQEDLHAAAITLSAEIAKAWFRIIEQRGQQRLLSDQLETNEKYLDIITLKFRQGQVSATDVLQQRQVVEATIGKRVLIESNIETLEHQLAVLLGRAPGQLRIDTPHALPALPPLPKTGLPADLVRRRPDVRAAELRVHAADRQVAVAIAERFPKLTFTMSAETTAGKIKNLFDNWWATLVANLLAPIFDAGERKAEIERTRAVLSEQLNSYGNVVLTALQEVEDALVQERKQAEYVDSLERQLELSSKATSQTLESYTKGTVDFTRYLTTLLSHQQLQQDLLTARLNLVLYRIQLYRALAGGWELPHPRGSGIVPKDS